MKSPSTDIPTDDGYYRITATYPTTNKSAPNGRVRVRLVPTEDCRNLQSSVDFLVTTFGTCVNLPLSQ